MTGRSLRLRLLVAGAVSVVLALGLALAGLSALFAAHVERRAVEELAVQLDQILAGIERDSAGTLSVGSAPTDARFTRPLGGLYWQIEAEGQQLRSRSLWDFAIDLPPDRLRDGVVHVHDLAGPGGAELLVLERSVRLPARLSGGELRAAVAMDAARLDEAVTEFRADLVPYAALLALFLILAGAAQVTIGLRPLKAVGREVARVRSGAVARIGTEFPAEILPLVTEVDALLEQRERDIAQARHRAGDLAHGLKTPLQALLGEARRLRKAGQSAPATAIEQIVDTMHGHVDRELARARVAARGAAAQSDLAVAVGQVVTVLQRAGTPDAPLDWEVDLPTGLWVAADMEDISEILGALLENAARHARSKVRVSCRLTASSVVLSIADDGPGIPPEQIEWLMQRGVRADETGPGTGLGLAIAREVAEALGGWLDLVPGAQGLTARVTLPLTRAS